MVVLITHGFQTTTETLPRGPHQEADAAAPFHSKLGSVLSQSVDWPLSQIATVGGCLNDCEKLKKDLSGGAVVLCADFPTAFLNHWITMGFSWGFMVSHTVRPTMATL